MTKEEIIQQQLVAQFPATDGKFRIQRERRIWVEVPLDIFIQFFQYAKEELKFVEFCTMTGLDEGANLGFIYYLAQEYTGIMLNIKISAPKTDPIIPTVTQFFPSAEIPEREVEDLLGAKVDGLAPGRRYPLPDDWPQNDHPLLKDWKPQAAAVKTEVQNG
jgi:Ni,Fe-hydrogenase III component G